MAFSSWPRTNLAVMAWVLAFGVVVHKTAKSDWVTSPFSAAITIAVLWLLLRPDSFSMLAIIFAGAIGQQVIGFDLKGNHWLFVALVGVVVVGLYAAPLIRDRSPPSMADVEPSLMPFLRTSWVVLWILITLHKANSGFFDTVSGCAVEFYDDARDRLLVLPDLTDSSFVDIVPVGVFGAELAIPLLLLFRSTRAAGILLGVAFHLLSGTAVPSFGAVALAFYVPFLPDDFHQTLHRTVDVISARLPIFRLAGRAVFVCCAAVAAVGTMENLFDRPEFDGYRPAIALLLGIAPALAALLVLTLWRERTWSLEVRGFRTTSALQLTVVIVIAVNGVLPYLGVKTENSYSMFSNLRTEAGLWNHVLIPESVRVFGNQDDLVTILDTNLEGITEFDDRFEAELAEITWVSHDLHRLVREHCRDTDEPALLVYRDGVSTEPGGEVRRVDDVCADDAELLGDGGIVWDRLFIFRPVVADNTCQH